MITAILANAALFLFLDAASTAGRALADKDQNVGCVGVVFATLMFVTAIGLTVLTVLANVLPWHLS